MLRDRFCKKSKARSTDRAFFWAITGLALCLTQFLQTVCTAFGKTLGIFTALGLFSATFNQAFLFKAIAATFSNTFGVSAFVGTVRTTFSNGAFGVVTVFFFLRTAASQGLAGFNGLGFVLWDCLFSGWQGKGTGSQDR